MNCDLTLTYRTEEGIRTLTGPGETEDLILAVADPGHRRVTVTARRPVTLISYEETGHDFWKKGTGSPKNTRYFLNGYQSWTDTREFLGGETERDVTRLPKKLVDTFSFDRYGDALFFPYSKDILHGYDLFYAEGAVNGFVASLNLTEAYLIARVEKATGRISLQSDVKGAALQPGETFTVCDYLYAGGKEEGMAAFRAHFPEREIQKIFGYTSWYNYYQNVSEEILLRDLAGLDDRFNLFQIDDGYETFVGDWLEVDPVKFPRGLAPLVEQIHGRGYMAGIWLAPLAAEEKSRVFREHPDWIRKDGSGAPVKCGFNWSGFYALDMDNPEAREYIRRCLHHYVDMGFDFFKLDFLYAANLPLYGGKTRCRAASEAYAFLRECLGDKLILGCGATLANGAGIFDYMRIGPDVSLKFDDAFYMRFMHRERISTKVTLQNTVYRSFLNRRFFGNDPDVFLLRDDNLSLTKEQRRALITLNALFGSVLMTSDNLGAYDEEKRRLLDGALQLFQKTAVTGYARQGREIRITYTLEGEERSIRYDTKKGVLL